jgi:UDP-N-acetylglucosamine 1-carboxyvinyltransferase
MSSFHILGGTPLAGAVHASGSKNAALPIMAASILASEPVWLEGVPNLVDVDTLSLLLGFLGVEVKRTGERESFPLRIETIDDEPVTASHGLVRRMRASFCVLGPLLARRGRAIVSLPGGCRIGDRPVDLHLKGFAALGAEIRFERGYVIAEARRLKGAQVHMSGRRGPTVTGTANVLCAATLARGRTIITGAAREPEIVDLGRFLKQLGARIDGLGTSTIEVTGVEQLGSARHRVIPDRIEAATLLIAGAITGGDVTIHDVIPEHLEAVLHVLDQAGATLNVERRSVRIRTPQLMRGFDVTAQPYPGVPTDVQAQLMALACVANGPSVVRDDVFAERFSHVAELNRLGAKIERHGQSATIQGSRRLLGAPVIASDLRASAALVLAALATEGKTDVHRIQHLDRGYERLDGKLARLGGRVVRHAAAAEPLDGSTVDFPKEQISAGVFPPTAARPFADQSVRSLRPVQSAVPFATESPGCQRSTGK